MIRHCTCCGKPFEPRPQVPDQAFCSSPDCQRARKRQWQRAKFQSDPDYRVNQRAAQQAWSQRNQDYWRAYRDAGTVRLSFSGKMHSHLAGILRQKTRKNTHSNALESIE